MTAGNETNHFGLVEAHACERIDVRWKRALRLWNARVVGPGSIDTSSVEVNFGTTTVNTLVMRYEDRRKSHISYQFSTE